MAAHSSTTRTNITAPDERDLRWAPCSYCWGQRRILSRVQAANGEGPVLHAETCPTCLGIGEVLR